MRCISVSGWGNAELQIYCKDSAEVQAGQLKLTASVRDGRYYSAKVHTKGKQDFWPGQSANGIRIEATIKLPDGSCFCSSEVFTDGSELENMNFLLVVPKLCQILQD